MAGNTDIILIKYNPKGVWQWSQQIWRPHMDYVVVFKLINQEYFRFGSTDKPLKNSKKGKFISIFWSSSLT